MSMLTVVAFVVAQESVAELPAVIEVGEALNEVIFGFAAGAFTVILTVAVTVPPSPVAVAV